MEVRCNSRCRDRGEQDLDRGEAQISKAAWD